MVRSCSCSAQRLQKLARHRQHIVTTQHSRNGSVRLTDKHTHKRARAHNIHRSCFQVATIQVPFLFKHAIDGLAEPSLAAVVDPTSSGLLIAAGLTPPALMVAYGVTRIAADGMQQLRNALFAYVTEGAVRQTSLRAFEQLMALDLSFHLNRQTGALSRTVERGSKAVGTVLSMSVSSRGLRDESPSHDVPDLIYLAAEGTSLLLSAG